MTTDLGPDRAVDRRVSPDPVDRVVDALTEAGLLDGARRAEGRAVVADALAVRQPENAGLPRLVEVVAYLGAALVLAAASLFLVRQWDSLEFAARVGLLAIVTAALAVGGSVTTRSAGGRTELLTDQGDSRRRLASTLLVGAALTGAFLVGLVWDHQLPDSDTSPEVYWPAFAAGVVLAVASAIAYRMAPSALGQLGVLAGLLTVVLTLVDLVENNTGAWIGLILFGLGAAWLVAAEAGAFQERSIARALGVTVALIGAQVPVLDDPAWLGYALTGLVVVAGVGLYLGRTAWPYLAAAVVGITLVVPEMVTDWTEGSLGAVGAVLVTGLTLLLASFAGYRLRAETTQT